MTKTGEKLHKIRKGARLIVDDDVIRYNPSDGCLRDLKREQPRDKIKALTEAEQKRFIDFLYYGDKFFARFPIFALFLSTGMRVGELTGLTWQDVDFNAKTISVNHTLVYYPDTDRKQKYAINSTKTPASVRTIPFGVLAPLALQLAQERAKEKPSRMTIDGYSGFVFTNRFGDVYNQEALNRALRDRIIPQANAEAVKKGLTLLPDFSCHTLRHTFCTNLCMAGVNLKAIQEIMGHKDISTTMNIYTDCTQKAKIDSILTVERYMRQTHYSIKL